MTRRIRNALIGAAIAVVIWVLWSLIRHAAIEGSLVFENIGRAIPAALLGAIAGYFITHVRPADGPELPVPDASAPATSIDPPLMPDADDQPSRRH